MAGKGNSKLLVTHPKSRKVRQLQRQLRREKRIGEQEAKRNGKAALETVRLLWFREQCLALGRTKVAFTPEEAQELAEHYLRRNDDEITMLKSLRNPPVGRIKTLEALKTSETDAFVSCKGIIIPDITDSDNLEILTTIWDGQTTTAGVVRRMGLVRGDAKPQTAFSNELKGKLLPIDQVRERSGDSTPRKTQKFRMMARAQSVKKIPDAGDVLLRSKKREADQQANRLKRGREAALRAKRG